MDWELYCTKYRDLWNANINTKDKAINHWEKFGFKENRSDKDIIDQNRYNYIENKIENKTRLNILNYYYLSLQKENNKNKFKNIKKIIIIVNFYLKSIAINIEKFLKKYFDTQILYNLNNIETSEKILYIIIDFRLNIINKIIFYIFYQVEQNFKFFKNNYTINLMRTNTILEFSIKRYNIYSYFVNYNKIYYFPSPFYNYNNSNEENFKIKHDILFYGSINKRRSKILNYLKKKYNIYIALGILDNERDELIKSSKIIINLHYYDNASLETTRLNEILKYNKIILSENVNEDEWYNHSLYQNFIIFFDIINDNLSNINKLTNVLDYFLKNNNEYQQKVNYIKNNKQKLVDISNFFINKTLYSLDLLENDNIYYDVNSENIYCLHLIELPKRIESLKKQKIFNNLTIYPIIKYDIEWLEWGKTYKNIIKNAIRCDIDRITICEDNCKFENNFIEKYEIIISFLNNINWDIFVGCIPSLPKDIIFGKIIKYKEIIFIEIENIYSTIFNIYNKTSFKIINNWQCDQFNINSFTFNDYIKTEKMKVIITYPFYVSCYEIENNLNLHNYTQKMFQESLEIINNYLISNSDKIIDLKN